MHETINTIIALVGAVTGSLALWLERRDRTVRLQVTLVIPNDTRVNTWIEVWNKGGMEAQIDLGSFKLLHRDGQLDAFPLFENIEPFKASLPPGEKTRVLTSKGLLGRALLDAGLKGDVRLRAQVRDTVGRSFKSKPVSTNVEALDPVPRVRPAAHYLA
jgi:hypothetical protein